jgi:hypothetical protein
VRSEVDGTSCRGYPILPSLILRTSAMTINKSQMHTRLSTRLMAEVIEVAHTTVGISPSACLAAIHCASSITRDQGSNKVKQGVDGRLFFFLDSGEIPPLLSMFSLKAKPL